MSVAITRNLTIGLAATLLAGCASSGDPVLPPYMPPPASSPQPATSIYDAPVWEEPAEEIEQDIIATTRAEEQTAEPVASPVEPLIVSLDDDLRRSSRKPAGSHIPARGVVRAVVFPVSLGGQVPTWSEEHIAEMVFGRKGLAAQVLAISGEQLRLEADIFPPLVDSRLGETDIIQSLDAESNLVGLGKKLVQHWADRVNLAQYDNDGPDGRPMSGDDDGTIDLIYVLIETAGYPALMTIPLREEVPVGRHGRLTLTAEFAQVLPIPAYDSGLEAPITPELRLLQFLSLMGVNPDDVALPRDIGNGVTTGALVQLGWEPWAEAVDPGRYTLSRGVLVIPTQGGDRDRAWMLERRASSVLVSDVRRRRGRVETITVVRYDDPRTPIVLPTGPGEGAGEAIIDWSPSGGFGVEIRGGR